MTSDPEARLLHKHAKKEDLEIIPEVVEMTQDNQENFEKHDDQVKIGEN